MEFYSSKCRLSIIIFISLLTAFSIDTASVDAQMPSSHLVISSFLQKEEVTRYLEYYVDDTAAMDINTIASHSVTPFFTPLSSKSGFGYSCPSVWFRFSINNPTGEAIEWFLEYPYAAVDKFHFYKPDMDEYSSMQEFSVVQSGDKYPFSQRPVNYRTTVIPVTTPSGIHTYYVNIRSDGAVVATMLAWGEECMDHHMNLDSAVNWIYYGVMTATILFNLFLFVSVRKTACLHLIFFISVGSLFTMTHSGLSFQYLWPDLTWWANVCHPFFGFLGASGGVLFTISFLGTATRLPRLHPCLRAIFTTGCLLLTTPFYLPYRVVSQSMLLFIGVCVVFMLASGIVLFYRGERCARFYIPGCSGMLLCSLLMALKSYGFMEHNVLTDSGVQASMAFLVLLLSFGLVDKINLIQQEKLNALSRFRESEKQYWMLAQSVKDVIWSLDLITFRINYITPSVEVITGYSSQEVMQGLTYKKILTPESFQKAAAVVRQGIVSNLLNPDNNSGIAPHIKPLKPSPPDTVELELYTKQGNTIWTETSLSFLQDSNNRPIEMVGTTRDVTERRQSEEEKKSLEAQLVQSNKLESLGCLAGGVAHDMNNILTAIMGYVDISRSEVSADSRIYQRLERVSNACHRARDLVGQVLTYSRQDKQENTPVNINSMVSEVLELIQPSLPSTVRIRQSIPREKYLIIAHPTKIHQIIMNLCTNAAYAMQKQDDPHVQSTIQKKKEGILSVSTEAMELDPESAEKYLNVAPGSYIRLTISDTGHGMDKKTKERIFQPFFTTKPRGEGSGMGLAMVHGIVKKMGGTIYVYSWVGRGTTFHLLFPRKSEKINMEQQPPSMCMNRGSEIIPGTASFIMTQK